MANIRKFGAVCGEFQDVADFITIYIAEANPFENGGLTDEYEFKYNSHKQMSERIEAAEGLAQKFQVKFNLFFKLRLLLSNGNKFEKVQIPTRMIESLRISIYLSGSKHLYQHQF